jgi:DNA-binding HxlR family transcriptional regulator
MSALGDRQTVDNCSVDQALGLIVEKWSLRVVCEAFWGAYRFDEFHARTGCSRSTLSQRLAALTDAQVLSRHPYREPGQRTRLEYRLTEKGMDLLLSVIAVVQWADRWHACDEVPPVQFVHNDCGCPVDLTLRCRHHDAQVSARDLRPDTPRGSSTGNC